MNVARLNLSHGTPENHSRQITILRKAASELGRNIAIMIDTRGIEIRTGSMEDESARLVPGERFNLYTDDQPGNSAGVSITYQKLYEEGRRGTPILLDDGAIELEVEQVSKGVINCRVIHGGRLGNAKSVNLPETQLASTPICSLTGLQPSQHSPATVDEYFLPGTRPQQSADPFFETDDDGKRVIILPENYAGWCRSEFNHLAARVHRTADVLEILSPKNGATFLYDRTLPAGQQAIVLEADKDGSTWQINGQPAPNPWPLQRGEWIIEAKAGDLRSSSRIVVE